VATYAPAVDVVDRAVVARRRILTVVLTYAVLAVCGVAFCFPFFWTLSTSLKTGLETRAVPPTLLPEVVQWGNYVAVWAAQPLTRWFGNSLIIIVGTVPGAVLTATLVAYAFARFDFPLRDFWFMVMLSTLMLPYEVTLIPQYIIYQKYFGWINTFWPLIVPSWVGGGAFTIFLLRQFLMTIPRDLDDAARVDGANPGQIFLRIFVPLSTPAIAALGIFQFLYGWNEFLEPLIYLNTDQMYTFPLALTRFQNHYGGEYFWPVVLAGAILGTIPSILVYTIGQRQFVQGVVLSGIKR
jgi:multiple sugar transport system permease protein